ncbi:MAG TPA: DUF4382 domain-containing protein [Gemmatimonadaceae bacterium]
MRRTRVLAPLALAAALAVPAACGDGTAPRQQGGDGTTSVLLTDSPFPYDSLESVSVYVLSVAASPTGDTTTDEGWVTIAEPHRAFDMLDLQRGKTALAGAAKIPAGEYRAVRMVIDTDSSSIVTKAGFEAQIDWQSSAGRPVLYALVEHPVSVPEDGASIVIDFDVGRSFLCPIEGCSRFIFSPVLRAVDEAATGSISGVVRGDSASGGAPAANATITVYTDSTQAPGPWLVVATGKADAEGEYHVPFLAPGSYILEADASTASGPERGYLTHVVVSAGAETSGQDITVYGGAVEGGEAASVSVTPATASVEVGGLAQLYALARDANGQATYAPITWSSDAPDVASVDSGGTVRALGAGTASITASAGAVSGTASITVIPAGAPGGH